MIVCVAMYFNKVNDCVCCYVYNCMFTTYCYCFNKVNDCVCCYVYNRMFTTYCDCFNRVNDCVCCYVYNRMFTTYCYCFNRVNDCVCCYVYNRMFTTYCDCFNRVKEVMGPLAPRVCLAPVECLVTRGCQGYLDSRVREAPLDLRVDLACQVCQALRAEMDLKERGETMDFQVMFAYMCIINFVLHRKNKI